MFVVNGKYTGNNFVRGSQQYNLSLALGLSFQVQDKKFSTNDAGLKLCNVYTVSVRRLENTCKWALRCTYKCR